MKRKENWHVFPLQPNSKLPYKGITDEKNRGGFYAATDSSSKIMYWKKNFPDCNWGLRTGSISQCFVVDIDVKNGAKGDKSFWYLIEKYGETPVTLTVDTPSGGKHYYFRMTKHVPTVIGAGKFGGIDIKSDNGYVLIPPSTVDGKEYQVCLEEEIAECPEWLYQELIAPHIKTKPSLGFNKESAVTNPEEVKKISESFQVQICERFLEKYSSLAFNGERNKTLLEMLCQIRDNGVPESVAKIYALKYQQAMKDPEFTVSETLKTLGSCYARPARKPSVSTEDLENEKEAKDMPELSSFDQEGIASYITKSFSYKLKYIFEKGWAYYSNGYWDIENGEKNAFFLVSKTLRLLRAKYTDKSIKKGLFECSHSNISGILKFMQSYMGVHIGVFDSHPYLINCRETTLDLRTLQKYPHNSEHLFTYKLNVEFDTSSDTNVWVKFLRETLENPDLCENGITQLELLQLSLGYSITGDSSEETMFYVFGETRSGKGTLMNTINKILGPLSGNVNTSVLSQSRYGSVDTQNFHLAKLKSCRYVVASETDKDTSFDAGKIKSITGNDPITCSYKFKDPFDYVPHYKIWVASNNELTLDTTDDAVWGRIRVFRFPYSKLKNADINLKDKLMEKADGIFTWICFGARAWYSMKMRGLRLPITESQTQYMKQRKEELDMVSMFLNERGYSVPEDELEISLTLPMLESYRQYSDFVRVNDLGRPYSFRTFNQVMRKKGFAQRITKVGNVSTRCYGIKREPAL